jgi:hypothetical protein
MKITFYVPAHPSYFGNKYTQAEIDQAFRDYNAFFGGQWLKEEHKVRHEYQLLREPGQKPRAVFNEENETVPQEIRDYEIPKYMEQAHKDLEIHIHNVQEFLKNNQMKQFRSDRGLPLE